MVALGEEAPLPPFTGFPRKGLDFLRSLKKNNNRPWFQRHKGDYEEYVRFPMQCLIAAIAERMTGIAPEIAFHPRRSIFRIHRDVRFSKDKAPYKTNIAASFEVKGGEGPTETPGLYVGIEPEGIFAGGGLYMPSGPQLKAIRRAAADRPEDLLAVVNNRRFRRAFGGIQGEALQRAPLGYPPDHPMIRYLRQKQWYVGREWESDACLSPRFAGQVAGVFRDTMPLIRWLTLALR